MGRGAFSVRAVRLGGPQVRKARRDFADPLERGDVFMYHDASSAALLDLKRGLRAVGDVLHAALRDGVTLARSLEFTAQWDGILRIGPVFPLTRQDFDMAKSGGLGVWLQVVEGLHRGLSDLELLSIAGRRLSGGGGIG